MVERLILRAALRAARSVFTVKICYVDESGGFEPPDSRLDATPVMLILGLILDHRQLSPLTTDWLDLKRTFYPGAVVSKHRLASLAAEVKGSKVRKALRSTSRSQRRHALRFCGELVTMLERYDARLVGRLWVKKPSTTMDPIASYTYAIQDISAHFNQYLDHEDDVGIVLCDSRAFNQDSQVSRSIFTRKHRAAGDAYPRIAESPLFGQSHDHVGLQLSDLIASAVLFPMAARAYCTNTCLTNHAHVRFDELRTTFAARLRKRAYRYHDGVRWRGGVVVSDPVGEQSSGVLWSSP